jgi:hypothetical protein
MPRLTEKTLTALRQGVGAVVENHPEQPVANRACDVQALIDEVDRLRGRVAQLEGNRSPAPPAPVEDEPDDPTDVEEP